MITCANCGLAIHKFGNSWVHADGMVVCGDLGGIAVPQTLQQNRRLASQKPLETDRPSAV